MTAWEARRQTAPKNVIAELSKIPGVGPSLASDLYLVGIREVAELRGQNPQVLYDELCTQAGSRVDRCVLYVFRCAVYYASESRHDPEKLKWWNWKDSAQRQNVLA
ncbi:MAG TPA: helix-hairpin-helix domain-containing protein [Bryobacteraceae bacterium]|nr:helix-hairpin-helix domain-containing protein [Bryobacteraceae bacterium]